MIWKVKKTPFDWFLHPYNFLTEHPKTAHSARLSFNLIYNLEAVAACPKIFMGLALVHFKKYYKHLYTVQNQIGSSGRNLISC